MLQQKGAASAVGEPRKEKPKDLGRTNASILQTIEKTTTTTTTKHTLSETEKKDPLAWIGWYIAQQEQNCCYVSTNYKDFEMSLTEIKRTNNQTMRLFHLCMYRVDDKPVASTATLPSITTPKEQAIASHRRFLLIDHALKELRQAKKKQTQFPIHGMVVYRMNQEFLGSALVDESYARVLKELESRKEADQTFYADTATKTLCFKI